MFVCLPNIPFPQESQDTGPGKEKLAYAGVARFLERESDHSQEKPKKKKKKRKEKKKESFVEQPG